MLRTRLIAGMRVSARPLLASTAAAGVAALGYYNGTSAECASWFGGKPKVHLRYFGIDGVAETIRHVMALGGIEWTESAWAIDFKKIDFNNTTGTLPIASPGFGAAKTSGELDANMGRAPVIVVDDKLELGQSKTIEASALLHRSNNPYTLLPLMLLRSTSAAALTASALALLYRWCADKPLLPAFPPLPCSQRYLARRLGLLGKNEAEAAQIDAITEHCRDIKDKYQKAKTDKDEKAKFFAEVMPESMQLMDKAVGVVGGTGPALIGSSLSLADVTLFVFLTDFFDDKALASASISKCPRLLASIKATGENPLIVKYRTKRDAGKKK